MPGVLIVRADGALYYANALTIRDRVKALIDEMQPPPKAVIIDASAQDQLDLTSSDMLKSLAKELQGRGMVVYMADVHAPVREFSRKTGLLELIGEDRVYPTVESRCRLPKQQRQVPDQEMLQRRGAEARDAEGKIFWFASCDYLLKIGE